MHQNHPKVVEFLAGYANYFAEAHKGLYNEGYLDVEHLLREGILFLTPTEDDPLKPIGVDVHCSVDIEKDFLYIRSG